MRVGNKLEKNQSRLIFFFPTYGFGRLTSCISFGPSPQLPLAFPALLACFKLYTNGSMAILAVLGYDFRLFQEPR